MSNEINVVTYTKINDNVQRQSLSLNNNTKDMATTSSYKDEIHPYAPETRTLSTNPTTIPMTNVGMTSDPRRSANDGVGVCGWILVILSYILVTITVPFSLCLCIKVVQEYERAVILRLGRILPGGAKGPGLFFVLPCIDTIVKVDLRTATFNVPPQEVLTRDSVTVSVDAVVYSRVFNPVISVTNVKNTQYATQLLAQTTLRNILGTKSLQDILSDRETIAHSMQSHLDEGTDPWGVKVERVEIKDVRLPQSMQRSMAAEAEATREARAKVIAAEGEQKASRQLKEAADVIAQSPIALQLRYLQTLTHISAEKNSTIIFPIPIELLNWVRS
jgi:erythrocyte band 7 integral membrane protein